MGSPNPGKDLSTVHDAIQAFGHVGITDIEHVLAVVIRVHGLVNRIQQIYIALTIGILHQIIDILTLHFFLKPFVRLPLHGIHTGPGYKCGRFLQIFESHYGLSVFSSGLVDKHVQVGFLLKVLGVFVGPVKDVIDKAVVKGQVRSQIFLFWWFQHKSFPVESFGIKSITKSVSIGTSVYLTV